MRKILLIKRGAIGDLLMATPLIRQLKQKLNCQLDIVVGRAASCALINNPYLDRQMILNDADFTLKGAPRLVKCLLALRGQYDYVLVLDKHWYFNLMAHLVGGKVIGYTRSNFAHRLLIAAVDYVDITRYHGLYYLDLLQVSGLAAADYQDIELDLCITISDRLAVEEFILEHKLNNFTVVINSGGNNAYETKGLRMLPTAKILALLHGLLEQGKTVLLAGSEIDFQNNQAYLQQLNYPERLINLAGKFNLAASSYLIGRSEHFYTTDCGAMHLGVARQMGARMTAFFGPSNPAHILPANYLAQSAIWRDQQIYAPAYQLDGSQQTPEPEYFTNLDINSCL
jgi:ADP-heptose:LPS heptosyltransferase